MEELPEGSKLGFREAIYLVLYVGKYHSRVAQHEVLEPRTV